MVPVTAWTRKVKQPRGGYLPVKSMHVECFDDGCVLNPEENLNPGTVGTAVDYISRVLSGFDVRDVFALPIAGAEKLGKSAFADKYISEITMFLDDFQDADFPDLIQAGVNLSRFDVAFKASNVKYLGGLNGAVVIDDATMANIEIMLRRILAFRSRNDLNSACSKFLHYKSVPGLTGADCLSGEIDILSDTALWDCKAMTTKLRATYTAQLLAYYVMLFHVNGRDLQAALDSNCFNPNSNMPGDFTLGFFNPRENAEYRIAISELDASIFSKLESDMTNLSYMY